MAPPTTQLRPLYRNRDYMLLWSGQFVSSLGSGMTRIVYPLLILAMTNSPARAGFATSLLLLPYLLFSLPAGAVADRFNRKKIMMYADLGRALILASIPLSMFLDKLTLTQIYFAVFLEGTLFVFFNVAEVAALTHVVPKPQMPAALAQNEIGYTTTHIISPSVGTWFYQLGHAFPFFFNAVSYVVSVLSLFFLRSNFHVAQVKKDQHLWTDIREGLHWLWHQPLIRFIAVMCSGMTFVESSLQLILIVRAKNFGASTAQIGWIFSLGAIGGIFGALTGPYIRKHFSYAKIIIGSTCGIVALFPLYGLLNNFLLLALVSAVSYLLGSWFNITQFSYRLALIPENLQGRVNSVFRMFALGSIPIGAALAGILIERFGAEKTVLFYSICYGMCALATFFNPHVRAVKSVG